MGKEETQLEKLQEELLELILPENKGKALTILKELNKTSKRAITRDIRKAYKSATAFIMHKNEL